MKVFVLGANGMLGKHVYTLFKHKNFDVVGITRAFGFEAAEFEKPESCLSFKESMRTLKDEDVTVINCIGAIKQKYKSPKALFEINGNFPIALAKFLNKNKKTNLIHISSDCVFSGKAGRSYAELDPRDATDFYGQSKIIGEECSKYANVKVIRTSIIGEDSKSDVSFLEWVKSSNNKSVNGYVNHEWNGVTCLECANACIALTNHFMRAQNRIYNFYSPTSVSKYDLIHLVCDVYRLRINVEPTHAEEEINRTLYSFYDFYRAEPLMDQVMKQKLFYDKYIV